MANYALNLSDGKKTFLKRFYKNIKGGKHHHNIFPPPAYYNNIIPHMKINHSGMRLAFKTPYANTYDIGSGKYISLSTLPYGPNIEGSTIAATYTNGFTGQTIVQKVSTPPLINLTPSPILSVLPSLGFKRELATNPLRIETRVEPQISAIMTNPMTGLSVGTDITKVVISQIAENIRNQPSSVAKPIGVFAPYKKPDATYGVDYYSFECGTVPSSVITQVSSLRPTPIPSPFVLVTEGGKDLETLINNNPMIYVTDYINIIDGLSKLFSDYANQVIRPNGKVMTHLAIVPSKLLYNKVGDTYTFKLANYNNIRCTDSFFSDVGADQINNDLIYKYTIHQNDPTFTSSLSPLFDLASLALFCLISPRANMTIFYWFANLIETGINNYAAGLTMNTLLQTLRTGLVNNATSAGILSSNPNFNRTIGIQLAMFNYLVSYKYFYSQTKMMGGFKKGLFDYKIALKNGSYEVFRISPGTSYTDLLNFIIFKVNDMVSFTG